MSDECGFYDDNERNHWHLSECLRRISTPLEISGKCCNWHGGRPFSSSTVLAPVGVLFRWTSVCNSAGRLDFLRDGRQEWLWDSVSWFVRLMKAFGREARYGCLYPEQFHGYDLRAVGWGGIKWQQKLVSLMKGLRADGENSTDTDLGLWCGSASMRKKWFASNEEYWACDVNFKIWLK